LWRSRARSLVLTDARGGPFLAGHVAPPSTIVFTTGRAPCAQRRHLSSSRSIQIVDLVVSSFAMSRRRCQRRWPMARLLDRLLKRAAHLGLSSAAAAASRREPESVRLSNGRGHRVARRRYSSSPCSCFAAMWPAPAGSNRWSPKPSLDVADDGQPSVL